jgi:SNF family Na+-dependent transporter
MKRGLSKGIELLAKIALPALFVFALILVIRVATIGTPDPVNNPDWSVAKGFAFLWNPNFSMLGDAKIWLAAAGQVFFTLSVGMGTLHAYASYVKPKDDIVLSGLATAGLNELAEVVLGAVIAIPVAVAFFGLDVTKEIAAGGSFNLAFVSMPIIFQKIPFGEIFGFFWFFLLFFAGITSTVAMAQPLISFLKERFKLSHNKATAYIGIFAFICLHFVFFFFHYGVLDEMDYWAGTFVLVVIALVEVVIFGWMFGMEKGWKEINMGADIKIPTIFKYIIKYVTPFFLLVILISWTVQDAIPILLMDNISPEKYYHIGGAPEL